jgi:hypothetical protein
MVNVIDRGKEGQSHAIKFLFIDEDLGGEVSRTS